MKKKVCVLMLVLLHFLWVVSANAHDFTDTNNHWATKEIQQMALKGIIDGFPDGSFKPDSPVTRSQLVKMVVCALGYKEDALALKDVKSPFKDVDKKHWANGYINAAWELGIVKGDGRGNFNPDREINRVEITAVLIRAMGVKNVPVTINNASLNFKDAAAIPQWALGYVKLAVEKGLIKGFPDNTFSPFSFTKRSESVVMIERILEHMGLLYDFYGTVESIEHDTRTITVNVSDTLIPLKVGESSCIYKNSKPADLSELKAGDETKIIMDRYKKVAEFIEVFSKRFQGVIKRIDYSGYTITFEVDGQFKTYYIRPEARILVNGQDSSVENLKVGDKANITLNSFMGGIRILEVVRKDDQQQ